MKLIAAKDYAEMSRIAADIIADVVRAKPNCVLGLATGTTPIGLYERLGELCSAGELDFSDVSTANLDEYVGLAPTHDQSYHYFMKKYLFDLINIDQSRCHLPDGLADDLDAACADYERELSELGEVDIQLLGIGNNGHVGFNEPCDCFPQLTHPVDLTESTIEANARLFDSIADVPTRAVTMGIGTIMRARRVLLVANGPKKVQTLCDSLFGPVTPLVPASILQFHHDCTVVADEEALAVIRERGLI